MARRRSYRRSRRATSRPRYRRHGHHRKGLIAQATGAVKKIGYLPAKVAGPLMIGGAGLMLAAPMTSRILTGGTFALHDTNTWMGAAEDTKGVIIPAAILGGAGIIVTKVVGSVLKG